MTKTLHPLPSTIESDTQADYAHQHLCLLCDFGGELIGSESFDLTPELQSQWEREFFDGPIPPSLLADSDWRFHIETLPGWENLIINDHALKITGENNHLWNDNGTRWFHGTRIFTNGTTKRERISLRTRDLADAQRKRDRILAAAGITVISVAVA
jgi:hypothetical protein